MERRLGVIRAGLRTAEEVAGHSRAALDRPHAAQLAEFGAELWTAVIGGAQALSLGAFQRADGTRATVTVRRGSGGPSVILGEGTVHVALALAHPGALASCDERRIVNRYVRPLLAALTKAMPRGARAQAHFFGSDWVDVLHRPVAWVGFGHDATTRRTLFEAFVAVRTPFSIAERPAFRGKLPATLEELAGGPLDAPRIAEGIVESYLAATGASEVPIACPSGVIGFAPDDSGGTDPPWAATVEEAIGIVAAGNDARGVLRVGGDLLVSRDALARLEQRVAAGDDASRAVDETLAAPGVALDGIRSLTSIRDVIVRARAPRSGPP